MSGAGKPARYDPARMSASRLAAVQALYSMEITGDTPNQALDEFRTRPADGGGPDMVEPEGELLAMLVRGTSADGVLLDEMIGSSLSGDWTVERLESILRAILRVGAWELKSRASTPARVVISEYVDIARAFYAGTEPGLVNAVLDRMARVLRPGEFESSHG